MSASGRLCCGLSLTLGTPHRQVGHLGRDRYTLCVCIAGMWAPSVGDISFLLSNPTERAELAALVDAANLGCLGLYPHRSIKATPATPSSTINSSVTKPAGAMQPFSLEVAPF